MRTYLIAYDIADPRRLVRLHHRLRERALHLQYSVFIARLGHRGRDRLLREISDLIDVRADDVRVFTLPERAHWVWYGVPPTPEAVYMYGVGMTAALGGAPPGGGEPLDAAPSGFDAQDGDRYNTVGPAGRGREDRHDD